MKPFALMGAMLLALVAFAFPALAQDTTVQIGGLYTSIRPVLLDLAGLLVTALLLYVTATIKAKFGIDIEAKHRDALELAAKNGINMALGMLNGKIENLSIDVKNRVIADALNYMIKAAPDAIAHFGLDTKRDLLIDRLKAKLTVALPGPSA